MPKKLYNQQRTYGQTDSLTNINTKIPPPHPDDQKSYNRYEAIQCKHCLLTLPNTDDYYYSIRIKNTNRYRTSLLCKSCTKANVIRYRKQAQSKERAIINAISPHSQYDPSRALFPASGPFEKRVQSYINSHPNLLQDVLASPIINHHQLSPTTADSKTYWPFIFHLAQVIQAPHRMHRNIAAYIFQLNLSTHTPAQLLAIMHQEFINTGAIRRATIDAPVHIIPIDVKNMLHETFYMRSIPNFERYIPSSDGLPQTDLLQYIEGDLTALTPDNEHYMFYLSVFQKCMHQTKLQTLVRYKTCINCNRTLPTYHGSHSLHYNRLLYNHTSKNVRTRFNYQQTLPIFPAYFQKSKMSKAGWQQYCVICRADPAFQKANKRYHLSQIATKAKKQLALYNPLTLPLEIQYLILPTFEQYNKDIALSNNPLVTVRPYIAQSPHVYKNYAHRFNLYNRHVNKFHFQLLHEFYIHHYQTDPSDPSTRDKGAIYRLPPIPQKVCKFHKIALPLQDPSQWSLSNALSPADQLIIDEIKQYTKKRKATTSLEPISEDKPDPLNQIPFDDFDPEKHLLG